MSHTLQRMRDELANQYDTFQGKAVTFKAGWDAAIKALEQEAGEFDEQQTRKEIVRRYDSCSQHDVEIARMMFASDRARIGHAFEMRDGAMRAFLTVLKEGNKYKAALENIRTTATNSDGYERILSIVNDALKGEHGND